MFIEYFIICSKDLKAVTVSTPDLDKEQNYFINSSSEINNVTTVEFSRKTDTGDKSQDMIFVVC